MNNFLTLSKLKTVSTDSHYVKVKCKMNTRQEETTGTQNNGKVRPENN